MPPTAEPPLRVLPSALLRSVQLGVVLLLLTPLVITATTIYPFVVGKALYWRSIVEIVFALWAVLALLVPAYRPPRSWVLTLLGAGLACSALAAWFGVSFQRSFWSTYERMEGVIDVMHQFAFVLVLVSVFRDRSSWRVLLTMSVVASCVVGLLAIASSLQIHLPFYGSLPERNWPRIGGTLGNATYLGAYSVANGMLALGFLARALLTTINRAEPRGAGRRPWGASAWVPSVLWLAAAAVNLYVLSLTGSLGAVAGLCVGAAFSAIGVALMMHVRMRWIVLAVVLVGGGAVALVASQAGDPSDQSADNPLLSRIQERLDNTSTRSRLLAWQAGIDGFTAKPLLGWGPENFLVVFGRYVTEGFPELRVHDRAHAKLIEEAVTKGLLGVAIYLALWAFVFHVLLRVVRTDALARHDRVLGLFGGAALAAHFVQSQTLFDTTSLTLLHLLLLAYVAHLDIEMRGDSARRRLHGAAWLDRLLPNAAVRRTGQAVVAVAVLAVVAIGLTTNATIWSAAQAMARAATAAQPVPFLERAIAFRPLAAEGRLMLFMGVANNWRQLRVKQPREARRVLALADAEAEAGHAAEPENWMLHHYLARFYQQIASTETRYRADAQHYLRYAYELAPYQHTFTGTIHIGEQLPPPEPR